MMNLSVTFLGKPYTDEIVLSIAESLVVFSMAFALCRACEYLRALEHNENPVIAGLLPDREEAFADSSFRTFRHYFDCKRHGCKMYGR